MTFDFDKIVHPDGYKIVSMYNDDYDRREWIACKLESGNWSLYNYIYNEWWKDGARFTFADMVLGGWEEVIRNHKVWEEAISKRLTKQLSKEAPCVCSSIDIFNFGCPAARGLKCRSMK